MAIVIPVELDTHKLKRQIDESSSGLSRFGKLAALAAGAAAFGGLVETLRIGTHRFMEHERVQVRTDAVLKSTGRAAHVTARQVDELAKSIMAKSGIDNEQLQSGENILLQFRAIADQAGKNNDIFDQATKAMADLSVVMGGNTTMAAKSLGKALQDPEHGFGALKRAGVTYTDSQKNAIKFLQEHNRTLEAQKIILEGVTRATGGQADALGNTLQGKLNIASLTFKNLAMDIAGTFMPAIANAASAFGKFVSDLSGKDGFKAKLDFVFESAGELVARFWQWWSQPSLKTVRSPTSGVHTEFIPPGSQQVTNWIQQIDTAVKTTLGDWSEHAGYSLMDSLFNGAKRGASDKTGGLVKYVVMWMNPVLLGQQAEEDGAYLMGRFWKGIQGWLKKYPGVATKAIRDWLTSAGGSLTGAAGAVWDKVASTFGAGRKLRLVPLTKAMKTAISDAVAEAVHGARANLASLVGTLEDMVSQVIGSSSQSSQSKALRAGIKARQDLAEETRLRDAVTNAQTVEDRKQAQSDLQDFLDEKEAQRLDQEVSDNQEASKRKFEDLVSAFNTGSISLSDFQTRFQGLLNEYVGPDYGTTLGGLFGTSWATSFSQTAGAILAQSGLIPGGSAPLAGPNVVNPGQVGTDTTTGLREQQYQTWKTGFDTKTDELNAALRKARSDANDPNGPGGKNHTTDEQKRIDKAQDALTRHMKLVSEGGDKLTRANFGLALGGILTGPKYIAGESGNEAVIPLGSPTAVQMMRKAFGSNVNGGASNTYAITVNAGMGSDGTDIGRQIVEAIKVFERRNGPVFAGA